MPFVYQAITALAANYPTSIVRLSGDSLALLLSTYELTYPEFVWQQDTGAQLDVGQRDVVDALVSAAYEELMTNPLVGTIFSFITTTPPAGSLECDGASYLRVDYPGLYAALDSAFIVDADNFAVPDLRGRVAIGVGTGSGLTARAMNDSGGLEAVTLTAAEMPSHTHTVVDPTHAHAEGIALPAIGAAIVGIPVPSAIPAAGVTAPAATGVSLLNTGGGNAHENMPPFLALRYGVWAR